MFQAERIRKSRSAVPGTVAGQG